MLEKTEGAISAAFTRNSNSIRIKCTCERSIRMKNPETLTNNYMPLIHFTGSHIVYANPVLLWPLDNRTYTAEVEISTNHTISQSQCGLKFKEIPTGFQYPAVELDGNTHIDIRVEYPGAAADDDYAFSGMFLLSTTTGTFFHYKADDNTQSFKEMLLWTSNGKICMERKISQSESVCSSSIEVNAGSWVYISFGIDISTGRMKVFVDGINIIDQYFAKDVDIVLPGILRIGASHDSSKPNLVGHVACVAYHVDKEPAKSASTGICKGSLTGISMYTFSCRLICMYMYCIYFAVVLL